MHLSGSKFDRRVSMLLRLAEFTEMVTGDHCVHMGVHEEHIISCCARQQHELVPGLLGGGALATHHAN